MKSISILGSTGSIGSQALEIIRRFPERFEVAGLCAGKNAALLAEQVREFRPGDVSVASREDAEQIRRIAGPETRVHCGDEGNVAVASAADCDLVLSCMVGFRGLEPTLAAVRAGKDVALANKESLVVAGELLVSESRRRGVALIPVDSEHSAIFQTLREKDRGFLRRVLLTASGGPFRETPGRDLGKVTVSQALRHPTWKMGPKITIDSATLMNKGFEIIETRWLFDVPPEKISIWVHPQSVVHSMLEFTDGSFITHLSAPDMKIPIGYALSHPGRLDMGNGAASPADFSEITFERLDAEKFEAPELAAECLRTGGTYPAALNAANEVAVEAFLRKRIRFTDIIRVVRETLERHESLDSNRLDNILEADARARDVADSAARGRAL